MYELRWNNPRHGRKCSIAGAHYDKRQDYLDRTPCDDFVRRDCTFRFSYEVLDEVLFGDVLVPMIFTYYVYRRDSDLTILEIQSTLAGFPKPQLGLPAIHLPSRYTWPAREGSCLDSASFHRLCSRFRLPSIEEKRCMSWRSSDAFIERSSGRIVSGVQRNTIEEHAFQCRLTQWSHFWDLPRDLFAKKALDPRYWSTDIPYRILWAFIEFPEESDRVELACGPIGTAGYWKGMVRWCAFT